MSASPVLPTLHDNFFVRDAIEFNMANNAGQPFYTYADPDAPSGTKTITHLEFGRAAHRVAHILRPNRSGVDGEVVAVILQTDTVLYQAIVAGLIVAGCVPFPMSPRNSPAAIIELITKTSCRRLLTTQTHLKPLLDSIASYIADTPLSNILQVEEIPSIASVYPYLARETSEHPFQPYPLAAQRPSKDDVCLYLHSSGSTGNPRPIPQTHIYWVQTSIPTDLREHNPRFTLGYMCMPSFHAFGIGIQLFLPIYGVLSVAVYPPNSARPEPLPPIVPSPENVLEHMKRTNADVLIAPPTFIQIWALLPDAVEYLKTLKFVGYGGGPLAPKMGALLIKAGVRLQAVYGGTEFGMTTRFIPVTEMEDWEYMQFHDHINVRWVPQGDGTFECQFLSWKKHQTMINNLPDAHGYATSDLWKPHPTKKDLWKIVGRIDDVIIHSSGEKTVPGPMEDVVVSNPLVRGAVIFGRERDQTGILIQPKVGAEIDVEDHVQLASLRNILWPTIEEANSIAPAHSRIFKEMILITSKGKPLPRAGKGTVLRKAAVAMYTNEINSIYENVDVSVGEASSPVSWSVADIQAWILEQAIDLTSSSTINPTTDLFEQGFDSLYATSLRLRIVSALRASKNPDHKEVAKNLSPNLIYSFPIIKDLSSFIVSLLLSPVAAQDAVASRGAAAMEAMIAKYTSDFNDISPVSGKYSSAPSPNVVLLTGSTGNLGSQILAMLLEDPRVDMVYAYNRPSRAGTKTLLERHTEKFEDIGLDVALLRSEKLSLIAGDAAERNLGLDQDLYNRLIQTVNVVIHNAWRLDFNLSLASYEPNVQGTRHFIDLIRSGPTPLKSRFLFISSIAAVQHWDKSRGAVPEDVMEDVSVALGGGYGEGKHVAERILLKSGLQALPLRLGQISGGRPKGVWPTTEWLPILVKSSLSLGALPDTPGMASWLGADIISATIVDIALSTVPLPRALNLVHPRPVKQSVILRSIGKAIRELLGRELKLVQFSEWFAMVEKRADSADAATWAAIPAIKLLEFFRGYYGEGKDTESEAGGLPSLSTEQVQQLSEFMSPNKLSQIGDGDAKLWVAYWHAIGFLN